MAVGPPEPWFDEVASSAGIDFVHSPGRVRRLYFPEIMAGGAGWLDYDDDGDLDLYLVQAGEIVDRTGPIPVNRLFRNEGGGRFRDVTESAGVGHDGYGMGCAVGDYDGDGDVDLYVTNVGPNVLYRNNGDGTFTDVSLSAGVAHAGWGTSSGFADLDLDGDLDLFVVNYLNWRPNNEVECYNGERERDYCGPSHYKAPAVDTLYRNEGGGSFEEISEPAGLKSAFGAGLGLALGDFDLDGRTDVYVANDGMANQLWINRSDGRWEDRALLSGAALNVSGAVEAGMGVQAYDIESDGDLDLFMTHLWGETNTLYRNSGGIFEDATAELGLAGASFALTAFGTGFVDFDHDAQVDLYVANGGVSRSKTPFREDDLFAEPNLLFRGTGDGFEVVPQGGTERDLVENSRAAAFGDYDGDGDVDVVMVNNGGPAQLLRNRAGTAGAIRLRTLDPSGSPAVGSRVRLRAAGQTSWSQVQPAYSYCAANDPIVHFGLGTAPVVDDVTVTAPSGFRRRFESLRPNAVYSLPIGGDA